MSNSKTITLPRDLVGAVIAIITDSETSAGQQFIKECWAVEILMDAMKQPDASITTSVPVGWKLMPDEPTMSMQHAALISSRAHGPVSTGECNALPISYELGASAMIYRAMLAAAPQPPALEQVQPDPAPYLWYDPRNSDTWTQEAVDEGFCATDSLIPLYTK